jgi:single-strand DNA-binding protein
MNSLNIVTIVGRLVRDPEVRCVPGGTAIVSFSIAANHPYQDKSGQWKDEVAFVPCVAFGKCAEQLSHKQKGEPVLVSGRLRSETWQKDGANHSRLVLVTGTLQFIIAASKLTVAAEPREGTPQPAEIQKALPF